MKDIRRATRRHFSAEEKIRIVLDGLRGEESIAELCRGEGIVQNLNYRWSKDFLEAGKKRRPCIKRLIDPSTIRRVLGSTRTTSGPRTRVELRRSVSKKSS